MTTKNVQRKILNELDFIKFHLEAVERWALAEKPDGNPDADLHDIEEVIGEILIALRPKTYCWKGSLGNRYLAPK